MGFFQAARGSCNLRFLYVLSVGMPCYPEKMKSYLGSRKEGLFKQAKLGRCIMVFNLKQVLTMVGFISKLQEGLAVCAFCTFCELGVPHYQGISSLISALGTRV